MPRGRGRTLTVIASALVTFVVLLLVQRVSLSVALIPAIPAAIAGGVVTALLRPQSSRRERIINSTAVALLVVVTMGLWMIPSTPPGYVARIILGWIVVAVVLLGVHFVTTLAVPSVRGVLRADAHR